MRSGDRDVDGAEPLERVEIPPVKRATRLALRGACHELARLGRADDLEELTGILLALGDPPQELEPFRDRWRRALEAARPTERRREQLRAELAELAALLAEELEGLEPEPRRALASLVLHVDAQCARAARALGRIEHEGAWVDADFLERRDQRAHVADLVRRAGRLEFEIQHGFDDSEAVLELFGQPVSSVDYQGRVHLRGPTEHDRLERMLASALRGAALSNALLGGELEVPRLRDHAFLLPGSAQAYRRALEQSLAAGAIDRWEYDAHDELRLEAYIDFRGWRTCNRRPEADYAALVLMDLLADWVHLRAQPALVAGHLNWVCLNLFGTKMPQNAIPPEGADGMGGLRESRSDLSNAQRQRGMWRLAQSGLPGCRLWLVERVREGQNPPWARAMLDHVGKIVGEPLLKTTMVAEYLQERGELRALFDRTRGSQFGPPVFEQALGMPLTEFEERWVDWLLRDPTRSHRGIVQRLEDEAHAEAVTVRPPLIEELQRIRQAAMGPDPFEFPELELFEDLSRGARAHASYLGLHPEQLLRWPDAHEEYPDRAGFSAEGAWAGGHSVIWPGNQATALEAWMATFYHRLPLLDPGLVGLGLGVVGDVVVLDVSSLVLRPWKEHWVAWPPDGARDVPLRFLPELPSPVPDAVQGEWGYPITLQVHRPLQREELVIELQLWSGTGKSREPVDCHVITPQAPHNPESVPPGAWCLIPKKVLDAGTRYTFEASVPGEPRPRAWSFTTAE